MKTNLDWRFQPIKVLLHFLPTQPNQLLVSCQPSKFELFLSVDIEKIVFCFVLFWIDLVMASNSL